MPHWMKSAHGVLPVYDQGEVDRHIKLGWTLLNTGEAPDLTKPVEVRAPEVDKSALVSDNVEQATDILDCPVVQILPLFDAMTKAELEALRAREMAGKARKGLLKAMDEAIEAK